MAKSLAVKYRPKTFDDVLGQDAVKIILKQQLESGNIHSAMLFCGPSGDGKTTCARIFANELNRGQGVPIEMDAASHNGVDDVREIVKMASTKAVDAEYKVFIIDECHSISNTGWQAFLKCIEEPPAKVVFIFCTTDPQKIPATILSRVQRFQFQKVSTKNIVDRLHYILLQEGYTVARDISDPPVEYIARLADGGVRLAIQYLEKCLAYSDGLTVESVVEALNVADYHQYMELTELLLCGARVDMLKLLDSIYASGVDFKQFIKSYLQFILDVNKSIILSIPECFKYINIPETAEYERWLKHQNDVGAIEKYNQLLRMVVKLDADIKYSQNVKCDVEAAMLMFEVEE